MEIRAVKFRVRRESRVGGLYIPSRPCKTPAVLMLHGFPGVQKNDDIAAELCRRGMTVFLPYFRGGWGSAGRYSLLGLLDDAGTALRLLSRYRHVDAGRIGLFGCSLGGWVAPRLASRTRARALAVMAPGLPREDGPGDAVYLRRNARVLDIPRPEAVWAEYVSIARTERPEAYIGDIAPTPLLLVQGLRDRMVPAAAARAIWSLAGRPKELLELPDEDHDFQNDRPAVMAAVCGWLESRLSLPAGAGGGA